ncbi:hypothetical protein N7454_005236 [Penicillium verhagenii]|nr:hypothetical protein N7454_005236 [Penicillium verhagenii]
MAISSGWYMFTTTDGCRKEQDLSARRIRTSGTEDFALAPRIVYVLDQNVGRMTASTTPNYVK